jgi:RimJ/RimL family protein N-acetyltransferase
MPSLSHWFRATRVVFAQDGLAGIGRYLTRRVYLHNQFNVYDRLLAAGPPVRLPASLSEVREATPAERRMLPFAGEAFEGTSFWGELEPHALCYLGFHDERVVVVHWVSTDWEPNNLVHLGPGDCIVGPSVTVPDYRGKGVFTASLGAVCEDLKRKGLRRMLGLARIDNIGSIRGFEKLEFRPLGLVGLTRILGVRSVDRSAMIAPS